MERAGYENPMRIGPVNDWAKLVKTGDAKLQGLKWQPAAQMIFKHRCVSAVLF